MNRFKHILARRSCGTVLSVLLFAVVLTLSAKAKEGAIQCANLIYGINQTSRCFSDEFLSNVQRETSVPTERRFRAVKLQSKELFNFPFIIMTGESRFQLSKSERENLKEYLTSGGFLLASAGCSNEEWDQSFRQEMRSILPDFPLTALSKQHPVFHTVYDITELKPWHPAEEPKLEGITVDDKLAVIYSPQGLNDTEHTEGCCCCGGNEILNSMEMNVNTFIYALTH